MTEETYETIKRVLAETRSLIGEKYGQRKRLDKNEVWRTANLTKDIRDVETWAKENK